MIGDGYCKLIDMDTVGFMSLVLLIYTHTQL